MAAGLQWRLGSDGSWAPMVAGSNGTWAPMTIQLQHQLGSSGSLALMVAELQRQLGSSGSWAPMEAGLQCLETLESTKLIQNCCKFNITSSKLPQPLQIQQNFCATKRRSSLETTGAL